MIRGVMWDLDGVYFHKDKVAFAESVERKYGLEKGIVDRLFETEKMRECQKGLITGDEFMLYAIKELKISATPADLWKILEESYEVNPIAEKLAKKLRSKYKNIICTNNYKQRIDLLENKFHFLQNFDVIVFSFEHGLRKPELFQVMLEKTGFAPTEILVLDDHNIEEAKKQGFNAVLCADPFKLEEYLNQAFRVKA